MKCILLWEQSLKGEEMLFPVSKAFLDYWVVWISSKFEFSCVTEVILEQKSMLPEKWSAVWACWMAKLLVLKQLQMGKWYVQVGNLNVLFPVPARVSFCGSHEGAWAGQGSYSVLPHVVAGGQERVSPGEGLPSWLRKRGGSHLVLSVIREFFCLNHLLCLLLLM